MQRTNIVGRALIATISLSIILAQTARAEVSLPKVFSSHMVLQRDKPVVIWGWAAPLETVKAQVASASAQAKANDNGEWKLELPAMAAGGPYTLTISGTSTVVLEDVMFGEVWLCSGQSNMEMGVGAAQNGKEEIAAADHPGIRLLKVPKRWRPLPQTNIDTSWKVCSPKTIAEGGWNGFSAVAYYFGLNLHTNLNVPIGLIDSTWGGTKIESWTPPEGFAAVPALKHESEMVQLGDPHNPLHQERMKEALTQTRDWLTQAQRALEEQAPLTTIPPFPTNLLAPHDVQNPTALYNGMIHPLCPFTLRGAIWYQGESNSGEGMAYAEKMKGLIGGWRQLWGEGEFPFYFVQIAPYDYGGNGERIGEFWEAQASVLQSVPNTGMAVINDIGALKDIHPRNKQEVGRRLALWALAKTYGRDTLAYSGPTFKTMSIEGDKIRVSFDHADGLASRDGKPLTWFELIDAEGSGFAKADATIDGSTIVISSSDVKHPVAMRFAWSMLAEPNLVNSAGLPAGAFRAGVVPKH
jgi:sialate O-acetylesterase